MKTSNTKTDWLFWGGIVVGLLIMIAGMLALTWYEIGTTEARLILCSGIGILFGAFGSTAVVRYKGITITGVAAIAIVLLYLVVTLTKSQATFGSITGDIKGAQIDIMGDMNYLGAMRHRNYDFVVPGNELERPVFDVYVSFPPNEQGEGEQEINFEGINKKYIEKFLGSGRRIEWRFNRDDQSLMETATGKLISRIQLPMTGLPTTSTSSRSVWSFIGEALAQQAPRSIEEIFIDLGSGVPSIRRAARSELASLGPSAVNAMMNDLRRRGSIYRIRLGILVALTKMLRNGHNLAQEMSTQLSLGDLEVLVKVLNDRDRTIRIYASEFLHDLGDPRVVEPVLSVASDSESNPQAIYLSIFIIKETYNRLSTAQRQSTKVRLQEIRPRVDPRTQSLIDSFAR